MNKNNTIKTMCLVLVFAGFIQLGNAQGKIMKKANGVVGFLYNYNLGYTQNNYDALNTVLKNNGALELPKGNLLYGFDYSFFINNVVVGGGFNYNNSKKEENNSLLKLKTREGYFKIGYVVFSTKKFFIYPTIGIGMSTLKLNYTDSTSSKNFNKFASLAGRATYLTAKPLTLNAELNLLSAGKAGGMSLILGYTTTPQSVLWRSNDIKIGGNPDWKYSHMYAKLALGFGKIMKMKRPKMKKLEEVEDDIMEIEEEVEEEDREVEVIDNVAPDKPNPTINEGKVFLRVDNMPEFPGGNQALRSYLANNLRYPNAAKNSKITKTIMVKFVVTTDGSIENIKVLNKPDSYGFSEEALRVVKLMAKKYKYKPGKQGNKNVSVRYNLPIVFTPE